MPMRVVRDDERGLVAWLESGTPRLMPHPADGRTMRQMPLNERFTCQLVQARVTWHGPGVLFVSPTGMPWSIWLFWNDDGSFSSWYVNLEQPHRRDHASTWTGDRDLDLLIEPDGTVTTKDADDLEAAVVAGLFTRSEAEQIHHPAKQAEESFNRADWPFDASWTTYRPDPSWTRPALPPGIHWTVDLTTQ
jgi:predicted RNA-binding protein associated with RNAse of E/G family